MIRGGVRWKPDIGRTSLETTIADFDPQADPPSGRIVMIAQLVAYDSDDIGPSPKIPYKPGKPEVEAELVILHEQVYGLELAEAAGMTQAEIDAHWAATLAGYKDWVTPAALPLARAILGARMAPPLLFG